MKSKYACFAAAAFIFLLIAAVIFNSNYTKETANKILSDLESAEGDVQKVREIKEYWEERRKILDLSHSEPELDKIASLIDELLIYAESGNSDEYKRTTACIKHAVENIREIEEFSLKNIF